MRSIVIALDAAVSAWLSVVEGSDEFCAAAATAWASAEAAGAGVTAVPATASEAVSIAALAEVPASVLASVCAVVARFVTASLACVTEVAGLAEALESAVALVTAPA